MFRDQVRHDTNRFVVAYGIRLKQRAAKEAAKKAKANQPVNPFIVAARLAAMAACTVLVLAALEIMFPHWRHFQ